MSQTITSSKQKIGTFPKTRYQGSKAKLVQWIWETISHLDFETTLDAFGGTGAVAYKFKQEGKTATYNDILAFNNTFGKALIENSHQRLDNNLIGWVLDRHDDVTYHTMVDDHFEEIYFTNDENRWIDQTIGNINAVENPYEKALLFFALAQACIIKRPYNLFHRKNLYVRQADVERSFGNKKTWDTPFEKHFRRFCTEVNAAVFDNGKNNTALNTDAASLTNRYDLVYIDTPYISGKGSSVDYRDFYHFLEGLTMTPDDWRQSIDNNSKHKRLQRKKNPWSDKKEIMKAFETLFQNFKDSILVVSYRSDGIPSEQELIALLKQYKARVDVHHYGEYKYALSKNNRSREILLVGRS